MTEENKTVTVEEFNALKAELETTKAEHGKLTKIFDERQTKQLKKEDVLKKDELLKALGIEKDPDKEPLELVNEKITNLTKTIEQLTNDVKAKDEKLSLSQKQSQAEKIAQKYNFIDVDDVMAKVDLTKDDIEEQIKNIAETKKHWIKTTNAGNSFTGLGGESPETLKEQHKEAVAKGDIVSAIALKLKMNK